MAVLYRLDSASGDLILVSGVGPGVDWNQRLVRGTATAGLAVSERRPVTTADLLNDPRISLAAEARERIERSGYRAVVAVPLVVNDDVVGALGVGAPKGRVFDAEDVRLVQAFADRAAIAFENARLFAASERQRREAKALAELGRTLAQSLDVAVVAQRITESIRSLVSVGRVTLYRLHEPTGDLIAVSKAAADEAALAGRLDHVPAGTAVVGRAVQDRAPISTPDLLGDARITLTPTQRERMTDATNRAVLAVPLVVRDRVIGALSLGDDIGKVFTGEEIRLACAFADQAALALQNATLVRDLEVRQTRLAALLQASDQLSAIQPLDSLLTTIAEACGTLLGSDSVGLRIVEGDELVVAGTRGDADRAMPTKRLKIGESLSGLVAQTGEPLSITNMVDDPRLLPAHREAVRALGHRGWLGVPVKIGDRVLGVLSIRTREERGFTEEDNATAIAFAAHAAVALENARLYGETRRAYEELSRTQEQLLQSQKMEAVGRLAGGIAHDFNNLLTIINGRGQLLLKRLPPEDPMGRDLGLIVKTGDRAAQLTRQLLAFSRKQVLQPEVLDLNRLVSDLVAMLRRLIGEHIRLDLDLAPSLGWINADPGQTEQIIMNLAVNARDAMPRGGTLTIRTADVELDPAFVERYAVVPGRYVLVEVRDTGHGMDESTRRRIFEPFFTTKPRGQGTGLGLSTVYGIVKQSGGCIAVDSQPGRGTTFSVYLPRLEEPARIVTTPAKPEKVASGTEAVLLVEDEDDLRSLVREALELGGYTVLATRDGDEAIRVSGEYARPIHLLLTDVIMPGPSGPEAARQITQQRPGMRVLYMSGYTDDAILANGLLNRKAAYLAKPFTPDELLTTVRAVLDASRNGHRRTAHA